MLNLKIYNILNTGKPATLADAPIYLQRISDEISKEVADFLMLFSLSVSFYAGASVASATGTGAFKNLDFNLMSPHFHQGLTAKEEVNAEIEKGFLDGLYAMCSSVETVEEQATGISTSSSPISFTGKGTVISEPLENPGIKEALDDMAIITEEELEDNIPNQELERKRLLQMANILSKAVETYINSPLATTMQGGGAVGIGTIKLITSPIIDPDE